MASLGTLAAELKLEGAAAMMAGLRGAGAAVSGLGGKVAGAQGPLARFSQALQALRLPAAVRRDFSSQAGRALPAAGRPSRLPGVGRAGVAAAARRTRLSGVGAARQRRFASSHGQLRAMARRLATGTAARQPEARAIRGASAGAPREGGDRLARAGGFIGGGGGPALDYHRRTAAATERTAAALQSLAQRWTGADKGAMTALWG